MSLGTNASAEPVGQHRAMRTVIVDENGVLHWEDDRQEVAFFGVNYLAPFSYINRALGYVHAPPEQTIQADLAHLQRMGLNAVRLHVWDNEISDSEGNLTPNEHLRLLDYLIAQCRRHGIHVFLTPIAWLGNGYPEPDQPLAGFSSHARKSEMGTDPATIAAEARYLEQFVRHINPYTKVAYKDDPTIFGFEFVNEPWSPPADRLTAYIDTMAKAIRATGCRKPLFYCASQSGYRQHNDALGASLADGVTFGWYPNGLVARRTLEQNVLPALDDYPLMADPAFARKAKAVYEFDGADLEVSCMYPAFARTFRQQGMQWATQFAYCPLPLAGSNTPYPTHYLNLVYTPNKAVSMRIAAEAFRTLPRGKEYGHYPGNTTFGPFRVDYGANRSEMITDREFLYSNDTDHAPPHPERLERIVGCGSSPLVHYEGTGSYFLEKERPGVWRLEVYPDAVEVQDPHGSPRLDREAVRILWQTWPMQIRLPDLGTTFSLRPLNTGNTHRAAVKEGRFSIRPGVYLLARSGLGNVSSRLPDTFFAPEARPLAPTVAHVPVVEAVAGESLPIEAMIAASPLPKTVTLRYRTDNHAPFQTITMKRETAYRYAATIPGSAVAGKKLEYGIAADGAQGSEAPVPDTVFVRARSIGTDRRTLTATIMSKSSDPVHFDLPLTAEWQDYAVPYTDLRPDKGYIVLRGPRTDDIVEIRYTASGVQPGEKGYEVESLKLGVQPPSWEVPIVPASAPIFLMTADRDQAATLLASKFGADGRYRLVAGKEPGTHALALTTPRFGASADLSARWLLGHRFQNRRSAFDAAQSLQIRARAAAPGTDKMTVALLDRDSVAWGATVPLTAAWQDITVPLSSLRSIPVARVPSGYPSSVVNALAVSKTKGRTFVPATIEAVQVSLTGDLYGAAADGPKGAEIESIALSP